MSEACSSARKTRQSSLSRSSNAASSSSSSEASGSDAAAMAGRDLGTDSAYAYLRQAAQIAPAGSQQLFGEEVMPVCSPALLDVPGKPFWQDLATPGPGHRSTIPYPPDRPRHFGRHARDRPRR